MYENTAHNIYAQNNVGVESPSKLIEMLYEGVLRFNAQAKKAMKDKNVEKRVYWMNRSTAVISELSAVIDLDKGGNIAHYLKGLYAYQLQLIAEAGHENSIDKIDESSKVFKVLLETWRETTGVA